MPLIRDLNNSFDDRCGIEIELKFNKVNNVRILTGFIRNIDDERIVIGSPDIKIVQSYESIDIKKYNDWDEFYKLYNLNTRKSEYAFSNPLMSISMQITDTAINSSSSIFRVGFNLCLIDGKIPWQGKGPILTEMIVGKDSIHNFINDLNIQYKNL